MLGRRAVARMQDYLDVWSDPAGGFLGCDGSEDRLE